MNKAQHKAGKAAQFWGTPIIVGPTTLYAASVQHNGVTVHATAIRVAKPSGWKGPRGGHAYRVLIDGKELMRAPGRPALSRNLHTAMNVVYWWLQQKAYT